VDGGTVSDYVTIFPERGNEKLVAEALLVAADNPSQVQVDSRPRPDTKSHIGFRVPIEVFERFEKMMNKEDVPDAAVVTDVQGEDVPVAPKKKVGRPKKVEDQ
jgi:hypothetical protein